MTDLLFVHDHKFRRVKGQYYSIGGLNDEALNRYTNVFGNVTVLARVIDESESCNKYSLITDSKVKIVSSKSISSADMRELVKQSKNVIVRMPSFNGLKILRMCRKFKKNYLIEMVGCAWDALWNYDWRGKIIALPVYLLNKYEVKKAEWVVYVTNEFLQKRYPTKAKQVNCSNVSLTIHDEKIMADRLEKIEESGKKVIIATVAAVDVKYKGQDRVIKALAELKKRGVSNIIYKLVGNGDQSYLRQLADKYGVVNQVEFVGGLPHEQVFNFLKSIDIYIQPSKQEGLPRALIEAMSCALPCIGAETAGIPELLDKEYVFKNSNHAHVKIADLIQNFDKDKRKFQAMRNYDESQFYAKDVIEERRSKFFNEFKLESEQ